jgi:hypothetical protein
MLECGVVKYMFTGSLLLEEAEVTQNVSQHTEIMCVPRSGGFAALPLLPAGYHHASPHLNFDYSLLTSS